jgi:hypothetical protein
LPSSPAAGPPPSPPEPHDHPKRRRFSPSARSPTSYPVLEEVLHEPLPPGYVSYPGKARPTGPIFDGSGRASTFRQPASYTTAPAAEAIVDDPGCPAGSEGSELGRSGRGCIRDDRSAAKAPRLEERDTLQGRPAPQRGEEVAKRSDLKELPERPPREKAAGVTPKLPSCFPAQGDQLSRREPVVLTAGRCRGRFSKRQDSKGIATETDGAPECISSNQRR